MKHLALLRLLMVAEGVGASGSFLPAFIASHLQPVLRNRSASERTTALSFALWLRKTS